ncbi:gamma-interferon-responsive lysosomal thiol protein isoform X2 [Cannabis sativa]|uniref:gamma-interferon-responsive lysosomal thiol protein isoform X2 n=1 Tax=Cannabis sativa TaxID=3483 RepID=UPI0029C9F022|nr:gamma-interferon-responsive lysosomal thiol protein isoform X2 [Cannabis sativa]
MDSKSKTSLLVLIKIILVFTSCLIPVLASSNHNEKLVSVDLYYETLCPDCGDFILNHLVKLFHTKLISLVHLNLVPYGNARLGSNHTISCQHGPYECLLNTVEACAIDAWPELNKHFPFIYCIEALVQERKYLQWETCYEKLGLDPKPVNECYKSEAGKELELQYGAETDALQPPHRYVPWVVVDGQPLYEDYENFLSYICKAYKGPAVPTSCSELSLRNFDVVGAKPGHFVSYKDQEKGLALWARIRSAMASWMSQMNMVALE